MNSVGREDSPLRFPPASALPAVFLEFSRPLQLHALPPVRFVFSTHSRQRFDDRVVIYVARIDQQPDKLAPNPESRVPGSDVLHSVDRQPQLADVHLYDEVISYIHGMCALNANAMA